jgi:hypothetical protein
MLPIWIEKFRDNWKSYRLALLVVTVAFVIQALTLRESIIIGEPFVIAQNLLRGLGYSYPMIGHIEPTVTCYIPPLYVGITFTIMKLGGGFLAIQLFNLVCLALASLVLFRFARRFMNETLALVSLMAICLYVPLWILAAAIEPDTLNLLLLALTIDALYQLSQTPTRKLWIRLGLLVGVQLLVRPDMLLGFGLFSLWLIFALRDRLPLLNRVRGLLLSAMVAFACVLPWTIRNYVVFHTFVLVSANAGYNLWMGNNPGATGEFVYHSSDTLAMQQVKALTSYSMTHDQVRYDNYFGSLAFEWIASHPLEAFVLDLKKVYYHWWKREDLGVSVRLHKFGTYYGAVSVLLLVFGFYGLYMLKNARIRSLLLTLFLYSTAVSTIFFVQSRHRTLKVDPFLLPVAVCGFYLVLEKVARKPRHLEVEEHAPTRSERVTSSILVEGRA